MRVKPTERRAIAAVLEQDHETAEAAAEAVIVALEELRRDNQQHVLVLHHGSFLTAVGPFSTRLQAQKHASKGLTCQGWTVASIRTAESVTAAREALEDVSHGQCPRCGHPKACHISQHWNANTSKGKPDWREPGCMGCACKERF